MASTWFTLALFLLVAGRISNAALRTYHLTLHSGMRAPDGFSREVYLINGQQPGPAIVLDEGDDLEVFVKNELSVETTIHWHGLLQRGTPQMDGVPGVTQYPIAPGGNFTYKFSVGNEYGFYWYHSHVRAYYNDAIRGPLMIRPSPLRRRPFEPLAANNDELAELLQTERDATSILLYDWTHDLSDTVYARYFNTGAFPHCVDSLLANGLGRTKCLPDYILRAGPALGLDPTSVRVSDSSQISTGTSLMNMSKMNKRVVTGDSSMSDHMAMQEMSTNEMPVMPSMTPMSSMTSMSEMDSMSETDSMSSMPSMSEMDSLSETDSMSSMPSMSGSDSMSSMPSMPNMDSSMNMQAMGPLSPRGCTPPMMFKPGFNISSLPSETCVNTTSPLLTIHANRTQGWLALNLVNSGAVSKLGVSLDAHSMYVYAADGLFVTLQEVKVLHISIGQRYSVMIKLDQSPGDYSLRFASYPTGDMQQVLEGEAIVSYNMTSMEPRDVTKVREDPASVWMLKNGSAMMNASTLDAPLLRPFDGNLPPSGAADITKNFAINQTGIVTWVVNRDPYVEASTPILHGNSSDGWNANTTIHLPSNSTIDIIMTVANDSMDMMGHPMHLHGHKFWVLGSGNGPFPYSSVTTAPSSAINLRDPPYRDTTDLPVSGWVAIRYITDNPGAWLLHCHVQWHMLSGMAVVLVEGQEKLTSIPGMSSSSLTPRDPETSSVAANASPGLMIKYTFRRALFATIVAIFAVYV